MSFGAKTITWWLNKLEVAMKELKLLINLLVGYKPSDFI